MLSIRAAVESDIPAMESLIAQSVATLQQHDYTEAQRAAALGVIFGVDKALVRDGTYLLAEVDGVIVACGAWSRRMNKFGSDNVPGKNDALLDPATHPARIRSFFVHPAWARKGIGSRILEACEHAARSAGFTSLELVATVTGEYLYAVRGYTVTARYELDLAGGVKLPVIGMIRHLNPATEVRLLTSPL